MSKRKLRVGIIGSGGISRIHFTGWQKLPDCEVVACMDVNLEAAVSRAREFGVPDAYKTASPLFKRDDIDVIDICAPNRFHKKYAVPALKAGKHVLSEKPLALTPKEVDAMIAASEAGGAKLMCAQHQRFADNSRALKQYLRDNPIGEVYYARAWYHRRRLLPARPGFIYHEQSGGGCCIDVGVHILDLALHLMDQFAPVSVSGISVNKLSKRPEVFSEWGGRDYDKKGVDVEDFAGGLVRFADGAALNLECSFMLNMKPRAEQRIDVYGTNYGAQWPSCEVYSQTANDYFDGRIDVRDTKTRAHHEEIRCFAEAVMGDRDVPVPPHESRAVMAILDGLYRSQKTGREVKLA